MELERQLEQHEKHQSEILSGAEKVTMFTVSETCIRGSFLVSALLQITLVKIWIWSLGAAQRLLTAEENRSKAEKKKFTVNHVYLTDKASFIVYFKLDLKSPDSPHADH